MAQGEDKNRSEAGGGPPSAFDLFLAELESFSPTDAKRIREVDALVAEGDSEADPSWFARYLSEKQIRYGLFYVETGGDFKAARERAGYKPSVKQDEIEQGPAMHAYMTAIKAYVAQRSLLTADLVLGRINRLALKAEKHGQLDTALRANVKLGEAQGMFAKQAPTIHVNAEGAVIQIGSVGGATEKEDEAIDAVFQEIAAENGIKALPERGEE